MVLFHLAFIFRMNFSPPLLLATHLSVHHSPHDPTPPPCQNPVLMQQLFSSPPTMQRCHPAGHRRTLGQIKSLLLQCQLLGGCIIQTLQSPHNCQNLSIYLVTNLMHLLSCSSCLMLLPHNTVFTLVSKPVPERKSHYCGLMEPDVTQQQ